MLKNAILIITASVLLLSQAFAQATTSFVGRLDNFSGLVQVHRENLAPIAAHSDMQLLSTDQIVTLANSSVGVVLADGTRLSLGPNSKALISDFQFDATTNEGSILINVYRGTMRMITGLIAKNDKDAVKVVTPTTVIGIRGTDFIVEVAN